LVLRRDKGGEKERRERENEYRYKEGIDRESKKRLESMERWKTEQKKRKTGEREREKCRRELERD